MSKRTNKDYLFDIKEAISRITNYIGNMNYEEFLKDEKTQDAIVRNIEIIGEAAKNLTKEFKNKYEKIEWKGIAGMRDKIIHFYFGVNWDIVWKVIKDKLPTLKEKIEIIIKEIEKKM